MVLEQLVFHVQKKKKIWDILHNNQHNMDHKLKFKSLDDHGFGKDFLDMMPKPQPIKEKEC